MNIFFANLPNKYSRWFETKKIGKIKTQKSKHKYVSILKLGFNTPRQKKSLVIWTFEIWNYLGFEICTLLFFKI